MGGAKTVNHNANLVANQLTRVEINFAKAMGSVSEGGRADKDVPVAISSLHEFAASPSGPSGASGASGATPAGAAARPRSNLELGAQLQQLIDVDLGTSPQPKPSPRAATPAQGAPARPAPGPRPITSNALMDDLAMPPVTMPPPAAMPPAAPGQPPKPVTLPPANKPVVSGLAAGRPSRPQPVVDEAEGHRLDIGTFELDSSGPALGVEARGKPRAASAGGIGIDRSIPDAPTRGHDPSAIDVSGIGASLASLATERDKSFLDHFAIAGPLGPNVQLARDGDGMDVELRTFPASAPVGDLARLAHPNLARTVAQAIEGSSAYLASEHLGGDTLTHRLATRGPMSWLEAVGFVDQACAGLTALHGKMLAHGAIDLNAIAIVDRVAKLSAPMLRGNARDDLAAMGRVLYELLCGHPPAKPVVRPRSIVPDVPMELDALIMRLLDKAGAASADDIRAIFKQLL
jgi:hypothetical protein